MAFCFSLKVQLFVVSVVKMVQATESAGTGDVPGAGRPAGFGDKDGEQHAEQTHQQADDGEAAGKLRGVSFNTHDNALPRLNRL
ncbi:hypothetical protein [Mesorhizobium sp. M0768]|uniref:hypothetical protein n=1 Tax=Mesorhizobium sp. M0768 TaxID=2956996 RepID=UPI003337B9FA